MKDAAIMAICPYRDVRREWVQRILDHDGAPGEEGGIEAWLRLAEAVGLDREQVLSGELVLPGVRFAVDAYLNFARRASWQEAASSSLTELFDRIFISRVWMHGRNITHGLMKAVMTIFVNVSAKRGVMLSMAFESL